MAPSEDEHFRRAREFFAGEFYGGEVLLWGRHTQGLLGLFWVAAWLVTAIGGALYFHDWAILPIVTFAFVLSLSRYGYPRELTRYEGITTHRVLVGSPWPWRSVHSWPIENVVAIGFRPKRGAAGEIWIRGLYDKKAVSRRASDWLPVVGDTLHFDNEQVEALYDLTLDAIQTRRSKLNLPLLPDLSTPASGATRN